MSTELDEWCDHCEAEEGGDSCRCGCDAYGEWCGCELCGRRHFRWSDAHIRELRDFGKSSGRQQLPPAARKFTEGTTAGDHNDSPPDQPGRPQPNATSSDQGDA